VAPDAQKLDRPANRTAAAAVVAAASATGEDLDEYRETPQDPSCTVVHYFQPIGAFDGASEEAFRLVELTVDGRPRPARRATRAGTQIYTASFGEAAATAERPLAISYTYRVLVSSTGTCCTSTSTGRRRASGSSSPTGAAGSATSAFWTTSPAAGGRGCLGCPRRHPRRASRSASTGGSCPRRAPRSCRCSSGRWAAGGGR
jgi:hypothetical protein